MANPTPEIMPEEIKEVRDDAIIATGRSDYPNQVNNLLGFPYIFRGALDVRAKTINDEMKIAAANAIAYLARERVPDEVVAAMGGDRPKYGSSFSSNEKGELKTIISPLLGNLFFKEIFSIINLSFTCNSGNIEPEGI